MNLSQEDKEKLEEHIQGIARILYQNTSSDKLKTFEDIEMTLREEIQEEVSPEIEQKNKESPVSGKTIKRLVLTGFIMEHFSKIIKV